MGFVTLTVTPGVSLSVRQRAVTNRGRIVTGVTAKLAVGYMGGLLGHLVFPDGARVLQ